MLSSTTDDASNLIHPVNLTFYTILPLSCGYKQSVTIEDKEIFRRLKKTDISILLLENSITEFYTSIYLSC